MAAAKNDDFPAWKTAQAQLLREKIEQGGLTLQNASIQYIQRVLECSGEEEPMVVIGIAPPYYPAVCNAYPSCGRERHCRKKSAPLLKAATTCSFP